MDISVYLECCTKNCDMETTDQNVLKVYRDRSRQQSRRLDVATLL